MHHAYFVCGCTQLFVSSQQLTVLYLSFLEVLTCPTCRTEHTLPTKGVEGFSTNFPIANLVELLSLHTSDGASINSPLDHHKCENEVDSDPATSKCIDCEYYLCENCTIFHKKQKVTKNHTVVSIADIKSGKVKQLSQKRYCLEHEGEELKLYCRTCEEVICRDCTIVTHKQHDYTFIKDVTQILLGKLKQQSVTVRQKMAQIRDVINYIHSEKKKEQQRLESHDYKAKKFFDDHIAALQQQRDGFLKELANASSSHLKQLTVQEEEIQLSCTCISSALAFFERLESSASNTDLAMMSQQVCERFKALESLPSDKSMVKMSPWTVALHQKDPLKSKVVSLPDMIAISGLDLHNTACLGKNTFTLNLQNLPQACDEATFPQAGFKVNRCQSIPQMINEANIIFSHAQFKVTINVSVKLPSGRACPVKIKSTGVRSWSVSYFISPPCPEEIIISVTVNNIEATQSPFKLQCQNSIARGTRVQECSTGRRATAHNADFTYDKFVSVTWDDQDNYSNSYGYRNSRPNTIQLNNFTVLSE